MLSKLKPKSEFSRNVLTLMTGTTLAQAIPIAISPILTRLYTPEDFGIVGLYASVAGIFGSIATGKYELAIMLPRKDEDAINILALGFLIILGVTFFLFVLLLFFAHQLALLLNHKGIEFWLYFIPVSVFFIGLFNLLNYFNNRKKNYKDISSALIVKSIVSVSVQLVIGWLKGGVVGLISGNLSAQIFSNLRLLKNITKDEKLLLSINRLKILALAKKYKDFPKFTLWAGLLNVLSRNLTNILVSIFFGLSTLGFYSFAQRILGMPSILVGSSVGQVFFQQATKEKHLTGSAIKSFNSTLKKLTLISIPFFLVLFFIVEDLFVFVFGEEWRIAGVYAKILIPFFAIRFVSSTLSIVMSVFEQQKISLYINIILLATVIILIYLFDNNFIYFLKSISIILSVEYLVFLFYYQKLSK